MGCSRWSFRPLVLFKIGVSCFPPDSFLDLDGEGAVGDDPGELGGVLAPVLLVGSINLLAFEPNLKILAYAHT